MALFYYDPVLDMVFLSQGDLETLIDYGFPHIFEKYIYFLAEIVPL